jgi:internalin A
VIAFEDPALEQQVRLTLGTSSPLQPADVPQLTALQAAFAGIVSLRGLECFTNLSYLDLESDRVVDGSPLASLTALSELYMAWNELEDVDALASLPLLAAVDVRFNRITDISGLANHGSLGSLLISGNLISNMSAIASLDAAQIDASDNALTDLSQLEGWAGETLILSHNQVTEISPLLDFPVPASPQTIDLRNNPIDCEGVDATLQTLASRSIHVLLSCP